MTGTGYWAVPESEVPAWFWTRKFVIWDVDGPTRNNGTELVCDGPLLSLFHDVFPNPTKAPAFTRQLQQIFQESPVTRNFTWPDSTDLHEYLRLSQNYGADVRDFVNAQLTLLEMSIYQSCGVAENALEVTRALARMGTRQSAATNNSEVAVARALREKGFAPLLGYVFGRPGSGPLRQKPDPDVVLRAAQGAKISRCEFPFGVFVDDSPKNVEAAHVIGMAFLGVAGHDPDRKAAFHRAGADAVVDSISDLLIDGRCPEPAEGLRLSQRLWQAHTAVLCRGGPEQAGRSGPTSFGLHAATAAARVSGPLVAVPAHCADAIASASPRPAFREPSRAKKLLPGWFG